MDDERYVREERHARERSEPELGERGQVTFWLGRVQQKTDDLEKAATALTKRLEPIRTTAPIAEVKSDMFNEREPGSPLAHELSTVESRLSDIIRSLTMVLREIDL